MTAGAELETVERRRAARPLDPYSQQPGPPDWTQPAPPVTYQGYIGARSADEPTETGRTATITGHMVLIREQENPDTPIDISPADRLFYRGSLWEVDGEPFDWQVGVEVPTKQVAG